MPTPATQPIPKPLDHFPPQRILVPVDLSEPSFEAARAAMRLGRRWSSRLELVHANDDTPPGLLQGADSPREQRRLKEYYQGVEARLRELAAGYPAFDVSIEDGYPKAVLPELAVPERADLVVMGTHGRAGLGRFLMGSVAEAVVRGARVPVLTAHGKSADEWPLNILVPMKLAPYADEALRYADALAQSLRAKLTILHTRDDFNAGEKSFLAVERRAAEVLGAERFAKVGRIIAVGRPAQTILRAVAKERFDLVVLAAHRKPFLESLVLGTTAERVLRHALVPVLSVPSAAQAAPAAEPELSLAAREGPP